jgi:hypothetical protein
VTLLLELLCLDIGAEAGSFAGVVVGFFVTVKRLRFGTEEGGGMATASALSSFFLGVVMGLVLTLPRRMSLPVLRLTLLHTLDLGDSFSSSWVCSLATEAPSALLFDVCFSRREFFLDGGARLAGEGMLRRIDAAEAVLTPEG